VAHLVAQGLNHGASPQAAVAATLKRLKGAFALAFLFDGEEDLLICARRGSPLAVGWSDEGVYLGSDALALAPLHSQSLILMKAIGLSASRRR
jgi:glucosamine--fructose-6-phosphate aminotransferase (isomerizing)